VTKPDQSGNAQQRKDVIDALLNGPDIQAVLRLAIIEDAHTTTTLVAASVTMVETLPVYVISHALEDARRRVREIVGAESEIFIEPDLVQDPDRTAPATDVIVIRASD
jgi:hypothetical protein